MWRTTYDESNAMVDYFISIHVPRVEDDNQGETKNENHRNFNPRPPCGGRLNRIGERSKHINFNPRPPCGGRLCDYRWDGEIVEFQSTSPVWRTTQEKIRTSVAMYISIHVPRVEDDGYRGRRNHKRCHFNPRPPCGGRPR